MRSLADLMRNFLQIGYVTDDIDAAASYLESKFGTVECVRHFRSSLGRANPAAAPGSFVVVDGVTAEEWLIDVALVNAGATNLEIIRPVGGVVDLYRGAIRPGVPATVHHLGFRVDDFEMALQRAHTLVSRLEEEPHVNPHTQTMEFSLRDPDGYYVTLSALSTS